MGPPEGVRAPVSNAVVWGWFFLLSSAFWSRVILAAFWLFDTELLKRAYGPWIVPVLGFVIAPWTTFAYAAMWGVSSDRVAGAEWLVVAVGLAVDVGTWALGRNLRHG